MILMYTCFLMYLKKIFSTVISTLKVEILTLFNICMCKVCAHEWAYKSIYYKRQWYKNVTLNSNSGDNSISECIIRSGAVKCKNASRIEVAYRWNLVITSIDRFHPVSLEPVGLELANGWSGGVACLLRPLCAYVIDVPFPSI